MYYLFIVFHCMIVSVFFSFYEVREHIHHFNYSFWFEFGSFEFNCIHFKWFSIQRWCRSIKRRECLPKVNLAFVTDACNKSDNLYAADECILHSIFKKTLLIRINFCNRKNQSIFIDDNQTSPSMVAALSGCQRTQYGTQKTAYFLWKWEKMRRLQ